MPPSLPAMLKCFVVLISAQMATGGLCQDYFDIQANALDEHGQPVADATVRMKGSAIVAGM